MKPKWIARKDYVDPWIKAAKQRGIKLSNKNLKRLDDCYLTWCYKTGGINWGFKAVYHEVIEDFIYSPLPLMKSIRKDDQWVGSLFVQPIDYTQSNKIAFDKYIKE